MHMTDANKQLFFDQMGYSEAMLKDNNQCPAGVKELSGQDVGPHGHL